MTRVLGLVPAPNITMGKGGLSPAAATFTDEDYVRAIRHGIGKEGKTLKLMPSYEYNPLSKKDLGALIAYLKSRPPVDKEMPAIALKPVAYVLTHLDKLPLVVAEKVNHTAKSGGRSTPGNNGGLWQIHGGFLRRLPPKIISRAAMQLFRVRRNVPNITATGSLGNGPKRNLLILYAPA